MNPGEERIMKSCPQFLPASVLILSIYALLPTASALPFRNRDPGNKLTASDGENFDTFGWSVAISGNLAIVGADGEDGAGAARGAAYVFDLSTGVELLKLTASDAEDLDYFGRSVAIFGSFAIVGAPNENGGGDNRGAAYVYDLTTGDEINKLTASDAEDSDLFGTSVAVSGNLAIVGAHQEGGSGTNRGAAYVFDLATGNEVFKLTASDAEDEDDFGERVAISGNLAVVGADREDGTGNARGAAYVFDLTTGTELFKLVASDAEDLDLFGSSVAVSGDLALIGATGEDGDGGSSRGAVYVFDLISGIELFKLTASDAEDFDLYGASVAISGNLAVIGARSEDGNGSDRGSVYVCDLASGEELYKFITSDAFDGDQIGFSVAISGTLAISGAPYADSGGSSRGAAYVFEIPTYQPDNRVGSAPLTGVGDNIYNSSAATQTLVRISRNLARVNGYITIGSDGDSGDDLTISATPGNSNFSVVYRRRSGGVESNITAALIGGTHVERNVVADEPGRSIRAEIIPSSRLRKMVKIKGKRVNRITRATFNGFVSSVSGVHSFKRDTVGIRVLTR